MSMAQETLARILMDLLVVTIIPMDHLTTTITTTTISAVTGVYNVL